jgi:hypothetical protein
LPGRQEALHLLPEHIGDAPAIIFDNESHKDASPFSAKLPQKAEASSPYRDRLLERGVFTGTAELERAIRAYIEENNSQPKPLVWTKTADAILASVGRFCKRTSNSDH